MPANIPNNHMLATTRFAPIADVRCPVTSAIANKGHNGVDEACPCDFASLSRRRHRLSALVEQFEVTIGRPDVIIVRMLTARGKDDFLRLTVTGEQATSEHLFDQETLLGIDNLGLSDDTADIGWSPRTDATKESRQSRDGRGVDVQETGPQGRDMLNVAPHILVRQVKTAIVMMTQNGIVFMIQTVRVGTDDLAS